MTERIALLYLIGFLSGALANHFAFYSARWHRGETITASELEPFLHNHYDLSAPWKKAGVMMQTQHFDDGGVGDLEVRCFDHNERPWVLFDGSHWRLICEAGQLLGDQRWRTVPIPDRVPRGALIGEVRGADGAVWYSILDGGIR